MTPITKEKLYSHSSKFHCEQVLQHAKDNNWLEVFNNLRRHPDSIVGTVLSIKQADDLWQAPPREDMLHLALGMAVWSNDDRKLCFLTDDSQYGWKPLKEQGWCCCSFKTRGTSQSCFDTFKDHVSHYYPDHQVIESEDELVKCLNEVYAA